MNNCIILQYMMYKFAAIVIMAAFSTLLYFTIFSIPMYDLHSLYKQGEIIVYHGKVIACIGGVPLYIYFIFLSLRVIFSKGITPPNNQTSIGTIWGVFSLVVCVLGFIAAFLIPLVLIVSPYSQCHQEKLSAYYVTDQKLCATITPKRWFTKSDEN